MPFARIKPLWSNDKAEYAHLVTEDSESASTEAFPPPFPHVKQKSALRRFLPVVGKIFLLALSCLGLVYLVNVILLKIHDSHFSKERFAAPTYPSCSCGGTTTARARELGCVFSPLAIAWLPPHCIDHELADRFDKQGPGPNGEWDYWSDPNMTRRLTREEVGELANYDGSFFATQEWHVTHCVFTWQKQYRSRWTGTVIERRSNGLDHIQHCEQIFRIRSEMQAIRTEAGIALDADDPGEVQ